MQVLGKKRHICDLFIVMHNGPTGDYNISEWNNWLQV